MGGKGYDWSGIHHDRRKNPFRLFLAFLSLLYGVAVWARVLAYRLGIYRRRYLPAFVISIGNLTAGGTGKTPAVEMIATWALQQGYRPAVLSRGYGGDFRGEVLVVSDGKEVKSDPITSGDEPYFLARRLLHIPVIVSEQRYRGGLLACEEFGCDFLILDDGFQHIGLHRDLDIVLLDDASPFGNEYLLPRGPLRETKESLKRADALVLTRCSRREKDHAARTYLSREFPRVPVFSSDHIPSRVLLPAKDKVIPVRDLKGKRVIAFAGIAQPAYFRFSLEKLGVEILVFEAFSDHHIYHAQEIENLLTTKERLHAHYLLMTGKDWVKVAQTHIISEEMGYVDIQFKLLDMEDTFFSLVRDTFDGKQEQERLKRGAR